MKGVPVDFRCVVWSRFPCAVVISSVFVWCLRYIWGSAFTFFVEVHSCWGVLLFAFAGHIDQINEVICYSLKTIRSIFKLGVAIKLLESFCSKFLLEKPALREKFLEFVFALLFSAA